MLKTHIIKITVLTMLLLGTLFYSSSFGLAGGGSNAGVGVINVPPDYADIKILQQDNTIRVYLTLSDYNSWSDIYKVELNLEEEGTVLHTFSFKQWESDDSFNIVNKFSDETGSGLLHVEACDVTHSEETTTIPDRCQLLVRFVFQTTYFSQLHVKSIDRAGDSTEAYIEYKGGDMNRDGNILLFPWFDGAIKAEFPPYVIDLSVFLIAVVATIFIGRRTHFSTTIQQVFYETK
jgi:hypothetical protein